SVMRKSIGSPRMGLLLVGAEVLAEGAAGLVDRDLVLAVGQPRALGFVADVLHGEGHGGVEDALPLALPPVAGGLGEDAGAEGEGPPVLLHAVVDLALHGSLGGQKLADEGQSHELRRVAVGAQGVNDLAGDHARLGVARAEAQGTLVWHGYSLGRRLDF